MRRNSNILEVWGVFVAIFFCNITASDVYALKESTGPGGSNAIAVHNLGQTGQDVNIGVILSRSVRTTHEAFKDANGVSHAFNLDFTGDGNSIFWHDTQLVGPISSRGGVSHPNDIGVAPGADIYCARVVDDNNSVSWSNFNNALTELVINQQCRAIVTGFQIDGLSADGQSPWTMLYDYYAYENNVIFANAAGNIYPEITIFGDAYNGITTGGLRLNDLNNPYDYRMVGSVSNPGPTVDGRRKPDITAPSQQQMTPTSSSDTDWRNSGTSGGETSYSMPHTAGAAALLLGLADDTEDPNDNRSVVIKAVLVNTAMPNINDKAGASTNPADSNNTWHRDRGYGRLDVLRAYLLLDTNEIKPNTLILQDRGWVFGRLEPDQNDVFTISVTERFRLSGTLTWHRRILWTDKNPIGVLESDELTVYLADLDMILYAPGEPNPIFSTDVPDFDPNNLEKCDLLLESPGDYTLVIENDSANGESADYGFAFELHPVPAGDLPPYDYAVDFNDLSTLASAWLIEDSPLDLLLSANGIIDFADFTKLAESWLQIDPFYYQY
ncbi:MAG: S8 family serine peptidase [Sedimentisphaerales bacterium]|nr:S8 family serine peptidase [Sedimentisphaerales bacterium]